MRRCGGGGDGSGGDGWYGDPRDCTAAAVLLHTRTSGVYISEDFGRVAVWQCGEGLAMGGFRTRRGGHEAGSGLAAGGRTRCSSRTNVECEHMKIINQLPHRILSHGRS